jgi:cytochrome c peroxidase
MARLIRGASFIAGAVLGSLAALADQLPPDASYRPLPVLPFDTVKANDEAAKPQVLQRQQSLLEQRYDLGDQAIPGIMMSGGRKPVQGGVRVKLPAGVTWDGLGAMSPDEIRQRNAFPAGFLPLPHVKQATGGQVFPNEQIDEIHRQEDRDLGALTSISTSPIGSRRNSRRRSF